MGPFDPPTLCHPAILPVTQPDNHFTALGYRDKDIPYYGAAIHLDGSMTINVPQEVQKAQLRKSTTAISPQDPKGISESVLK